MLDAGIAKECARFVLPLATPTRIYMTGSCRSWIHYINLRTGHWTQKEHMDIAKECARFVLPLATPTKIYMTGSCRSWIHYINLRTGHGTQKEHMDIAQACKNIFLKEYPTVSSALDW